SDSSMTPSDACSTSMWSMETSPNSLTITAVFWRAGSFSSLLSSVVLPAPRKPVRIETAIGSWITCSAAFRDRRRRIVGARGRDRHVGITRRLRFRAGCTAERYGHRDAFARRLLEIGRGVDRVSFGAARLGHRLPVRLR